MQTTYHNARCFGVAYSVPADEGGFVAKFVQVAPHAEPEDAEQKACEEACRMARSGPLGAEYRAVRFSPEGMHFIGPVHHGQLTDENC